MNTEHSPAPWHVGMNPGPIVYGTKGEQIADCRSVFLDRDESRSNVRLIVAAPDLLATCHRILRAIEWSLTEDRMEPEEMADTLRAAIAKVEG